MLLASTQLTGLLNRERREGLIGELKAKEKEVQIDQHVWKCWRSHSINHDRENGGARGGMWRQMLMSDTDTDFVVLALSPWD